MIAPPRVLIITGYGLNCEAESQYAWERAGARAEQVHLADLLAEPNRLDRYGALMFIGGFSFGDHMTSGHVFALRLRHRMEDPPARFLDRGGLVLGVCNGFQILVKLGLVPGLGGERFRQSVALMANDCGAFQNRWVHVRFEPGSACLFTRGLGTLPMPVRHGEGKIFTPARSTVDALESAGCVACRYVDPDTGLPASRFPANPNGSLNAIAGLCNPTGRVLGLMPHPEAFLYPENHPHWDMPGARPATDANRLGLELFRNAVAAMKHD